MILAPPCTTPVFMVSKEDLAELTSRPSTSAVSVAIVPALSLTTSCVSLPRWWPGRRRCSPMPSNEPPKMLPALIRPTVSELICHQDHRYSLTSSRRALPGLSGSTVIAFVVARLVSASRVSAGVRRRRGQEPGDQQADDTAEQDLADALEAFLHAREVDVGTSSLKSAPEASVIPVHRTVMPWRSSDSARTVW